MTIMNTKNIKHLLLAGMVCCAANATFTACSDDDLGASIYDTREYPLDRSVYTFPLDTFVKKNFLEYVILSSLQMIIFIKKFW